MTGPDTLLPSRPAPTAQPLLGLTLLVVEDSRLACEGLRLLSLRSGARLRRADSLAAADRHLRAWRPAAVIADLHLPDGSGLDLLARLACARPRIPVLLATSGDPGMEGAARAAGADGFLPKPVASLADFQAALLRASAGGGEDPVACAAPRCAPVPFDRAPADPLALRDDLAHARALLSRDDRLPYVARFLQGVARSAGDATLGAAAEAMAAAPASRPARARLARLLAGRIEGAPAF